METQPPDATHLALQLVWLMVLALPIACVAWTVTHEEVFRELRERFEAASRASRGSSLASSSTCSPASIASATGSRWWH